MDKGNYTYILRCADGSLYCGWTSDLDKRLISHNDGTGSKYTRTRLPVELLYYESFETKQEAMSREYHIKRLSRAEKLSLIDRKQAEQACFCFLKCRILFSDIHI